MTNSQSRADEIVRLSVAAGWKFAPAAKQKSAPWKKAFRTSQTFNMNAGHEFVLPGTRKQWLTGSGLALLFLAAILVHRTQPDESRQQAASTDPEKVILGTGPAYIPPEERKRSVSTRTARASTQPARSGSFAAAWARMKIFPDARATSTMSTRTKSPFVTSLPADLERSVQVAAARENINPDNLKRLLFKESSNNFEAESDTGATGLGQFTEQTFLGMVALHHQTLGLSDYAPYIKRNKNGFYYAGDMQDRILELRKNPHIAASAAAIHMKEDAENMTSYIERPVNATDSSLAYFAGSSAAKIVIKKNDHPIEKYEPAYQSVNEVNYYGNTNFSVFFKKSKWDTAELNKLIAQGKAKTKSGELVLRGRNFETVQMADEDNPQIRRTYLYMNKKWYAAKTNQEVYKSKQRVMGTELTLTSSAYTTYTPPRPKPN